MPLILFALMLTSSLLFADTVKGLRLIQEGKLGEGYQCLESSFQNAQSQYEKGRLAHLLAFGTGTESSQVYYARFALKYHKGLKNSEILKLKILIADSFMDHGEFEKAFEFYQESLKEKGPHENYVQYQLGYYYLNTQKAQKAFSLWSGLLMTDYKDRALRSIGRYWEKMNFPGNVQQLQMSSSFMEGFSVSVDEREKELTLTDLNKFVHQESGPEMLTLLVEKNPIFIKKPCEFTRWYNNKLSLKNDLIFPYLKKCFDTDKKMTGKIAQLASAIAATKEEKLFVVSLYKTLGEDKRACELASRESMHAYVFSLCEESSEEIVKSITEVLKESDKTLLPLSRVIRSAVRLPLDKRKEFMTIIGETQFAREFINQPDIFINEARTLGFTDETRLLFSAYHRLSEQRKVFEKDLQSNVAKDLQGYLSDGTFIKTSPCVFRIEDLRKIAIESRLISGQFGQVDQSCSDELIDHDEGLSFLASSLIISKAKRITLDTGVILAKEILKDGDIASVRPMAGDFGKEIKLLLKVQNFKTNKITTASTLLSELKKLKKLRFEISSRKWLSMKVSQKVSGHYNALLDEFVRKNAASMERLNLVSKVSAFIKELRLS